MRGRLGLLATGAFAALALSAAPGMANHHDVAIAEVWVGSTTLPDLEYVELEMLSGGQNVFAGSAASLTIFGPTGTLFQSRSLDTNLANGQRGRRILIGFDGLENTFTGAMPDFEFDDDGFMDPAGGAVCFNAPAFGTGDCVKWGSYTEQTSFPTGGFVAPTGITANFSLQRERPACGPGLIDTNSPGDWRQDAPDPFNNSAPAATGPPCPNTTITKKPRRRTTKRRAVFEFTATQGVSEFDCKFDGASYRACDSGSFVKRVSLGRHTFKVRAEGDPSPTSYSWTVKRRG